MPSYNLPSTINMSGGLTELFIYLNEVTYNWFSNMLLISIYLIFAIGFYFARKDMLGGLAVGGFATFIVGLFLFVGGVVSGVTFTIVIAVAILSFATLWLGQGN